VSTQSITVPAGPLEGFEASLETYIRRLGMPTILKNGVIQLLGDHRICKEGDVLTSDQAKLIKLFGNKMASFRVVLSCFWEDGKFEKLATVENPTTTIEDEDEVVDHIPWQLQLPALLPDVDGRWWCPLPLCDYQIDLHELPEEDRRRVPEVGYILQKQWRNAAYDDKVLEGFSCMVFRHYLMHLEERGVKVEIKNGKKRFAFINDRPRQPGGRGPIRGPMPALGTLGGESRVIPTLHAPHAGYFH